MTKLHRHRPTNRHKTPSAHFARHRYSASKDSNKSNLQWTMVTRLLTQLPLNKPTPCQTLLNHLFLLREQLFFSMASSRWRSSSPRSTTTLPTLRDSPRTKGPRSTTHISVFLRVRLEIMRTWLKQLRWHLPSNTTLTLAPACPNGDSLGLRRSRPTTNTCTRHASKNNFKPSERVAFRRERPSSLSAEDGLSDFTEIIKKMIPRAKIKKITTIKATSLRKTLMQYLVMFLANQTSTRSHRD